MATDDRKAWQRPGFIAAAAVIALVLALGIAALVRTLSQGDPDPTPTTPTPTATSSESTTAPTSDAPTEDPPTADASTCGLEPVELDGALTAAPETTWDYVGVIAMPSVAGQGPGATGTDGLRTCFARTPTGAVLSAANMVSQLATPTLQGEAVRYFIAEGPGYETAVSLTTGSDSSASIDLQVTGFKVLDYSGDQALVDIAVQATGNGITTYTSFRTPLIWQNGDWRQVPAANGQPQYPPVQLPNTADYVAWSAS